MALPSYLITYALQYQAKGTALLFPWYSRVSSKLSQQYRQEVDQNYWYTLTANIDQTGVHSAQPCSSDLTNSSFLWSSHCRKRSLVPNKLAKSIKLFLFNFRKTKSVLSNETLLLRFILFMFSHFLFFFLFLYPTKNDDNILLYVHIAH